MKKNKHIGSSFEDYLKKTLTKEEIMEIEKEAQKEVEKLREEKREAVKLEAFLIEQGLTESYPKKNIRIYFQRNEDRKIYNVEVIELDLNWFKTDRDRVKRSNHQYNSYSDIGNANFDLWDWETSTHIIYIFFGYYGFENKEVEAKAICELSKIKEWRIDMAKILRRFNLLNLSDYS